MGLFLALLTWGWFVPTVVALAIVASAMLVVLPCLGRVDARRAANVLDWAALTALGAVGLTGLIAALGAVGLLLLFLLTINAPAVRRTILDLHTALRLALVLVQEQRTHRPPSRQDDGW